VNQAYELVQQFAHMLRTRTGQQLDAWLEQVRERGIRELQGFVVSIERDKAAVVAGLTLPQNDGLVEGKVEFAQTHQADDVRESSISAVTSVCSSRPLT
jgi:transposase